MNKVKAFFVRNKAKVVAAGSVAAATLGSAVSTFAYSPKPIPSSADGMSFSALGDLWEYAASMLLDTIQIVASQPLMVAMVALSLIGIGVGLFKRLISA